MNNISFKNFVMKQMCKINPKWVANRAYRSVFGVNIQWDNPKTLIEKIYWLQLYSDTSMWTKCADKIKVHEYVTEKGLGHILTPIFGQWSNPDKIDWNSLPDSFVLKTNNGSGQVIIVRDKKNIDKQATISKLRKWLKEDYGTYDVQLHYTKIHKTVFAEKLLETSNGGTTDFKIWCINGEPRLIMVIYERWQAATGYKTAIFDLEWNNRTKDLTDEKHTSVIDNTIPKRPKSLAMMLDYARILSADFPEVRVDFYEQEGKPVFGELTFTTGYAKHSLKLDLELGKYLDISKAKRVNGMNRLAWYK